SIWIFLGLSFASLVAVFWRSKNYLDTLFAQAFPAFSLLGFVLLMAPWGMGGYLNSVAAPLFAACALTLLPGLPDFLKRHRLLTRAAIALVLALFSLEIFIDSTTKMDVRRALE